MLELFLKTEAKKEENRLQASNGELDSTSLYVISPGRDELVEVLRPTYPQNDFGLEDNVTFTSELYEE